MERGFAVHALNPKQLDRFSVSGAKDDLSHFAKRSADGDRRMLCIR